MRRGVHGKGIHRLEDGTLLGVNLGADFTAEHEWGIQRLREVYGIDDAAEGIGRRQIRQFPSNHILFGDVKVKTRDWETRKTASRKWWGLISFRYPADLRPVPEMSEETIRRCELTPFGNHDIYGAWDETSFGFLVRDERVAREIYDALARCDLCIGLFNGESSPFSRSGLGLLIASRIPQSVREQWLESDRDARRLKEASDATGIVKRLKAAGKGYHALSPRWATNMKKKTKHPVIYWLNPSEQHTNNFGWFTVEELDAWIEGKGPIPKKKEVVS